MDDNEYRLICKNFRNKARASFNYLIEEFNYKLKHESDRSKSGSIIVDTLIYTNEKRNRIIKISNSFHPKDYGFQLTIFDTSQIQNSVMREKLLFNILLINQNVNQNYLEQTAEKFKQNYSDAIEGKTFF